MGAVAAVGAALHRGRTREGGRRRGRLGRRGARRALLLCLASPTKREASTEREQQHGLTACAPFHWLNARMVARWSDAPPASLLRRARDMEAALRASAAAGSTQGSLQEESEQHGQCGWEG